MEEVKLRIVFGCFYFGGGVRRGLLGATNGMEPRTESDGG